MAIPSLSSVWGARTWQGKYPSKCFMVTNVLILHDLHEYFRPHLLCLVDAGDGRHLAVYVSTKYLTHGARGHTVGDAVNVDLFILVNVTHGRLLLSLRRWLAAVEFERQQWDLPVRSLHFGAY